MSVLGFEVHVDKENATPVSGFNKVGAFNKFGLKTAGGDVGKLQQKAPRKALLNVINEPTSATASRSFGGKQLCLVKEGTPRSLKPSYKIKSDTENQTVNIDIKQQDCKKRSSVQGLKVLTDTASHPLKTKSTVSQKKPKALSKPQTEISDEDYAIFPRSERLSSYVNKLMTWRPPCLFGALPDSESDNSDLEELPQDDILLDMPLFLPAVPEIQDTALTNLMNELPPPKPDFEDYSQNDAYQDKDTELSLDQTIDTSISFGCLYVMHDSFDISQISNELSTTDMANSSPK